MKVVAISTPPDGTREVEMVALGAAEAGESAKLAWPYREDDPTTGFVVGEVVNFQASPGGTGWLVRNQAGDALAFAPIAEAAQGARSERWR